MKAWRTELYGIVSLVVTDTRSRARAITFRAARDAGWRPQFTEVRATRYPEWDDMAERLVSFQRDKCLSWPGRVPTEKTDSKE